MDERTDSHAAEIISSIFNKRVDENLQALTAERENLPAFYQVVEAVENSIRRGGKILICGNGGNSSAAAHIVNDFVGHMYINRRPMPAVSLVDNPAVLTALANDYGYDQIFCRQVEALGTSGDIFIGISTSGNSKNVLLAAQAARLKAMPVIAMTNRDGGQLARLADFCLRVDSLDAVCTEHIHLILLHTLCECVEAILYEGEPGWGKKKG